MNKRLDDKKEILRNQIRLLLESKMDNDKQLESALKYAKNSWWWPLRKNIVSKIYFQTKRICLKCGFAWWSKFDRNDQEINQRQCPSCKGTPWNSPPRNIESIIKKISIKEKIEKEKEKEKKEPPALRDHVNDRVLVRPKFKCQKCKGEWWASATKLFVNSITYSCHHCKCRAWTSGQ
jgi:hypothetical protein